jgi:hypothetical protein
VLHSSCHGWDRISDIDAHEEDDEAGKLLKKSIFIVPLLKIVCTNSGEKILNGPAGVALIRLTPSKNKICAKRIKKHLQQGRALYHKQINSFVRVLCRYLRIYSWD